MQGSSTTWKTKPRHILLSYASQFLISSIIPTTSIHHISIGILIKNLCHARKHMKCTFKCINQVYELAPLLVRSNFNWSPSFVIFLSLCQSSLLCYIFTIFVHYFSPFVINDNKGSILDSLRLSMSINGVRIIILNLVQSRTLTKDI
jgi:hypothetical protein